MKNSPLYLGIDFGTTNSSVAYVYNDPRHLRTQSIPVEEVKVTMDEENQLTAGRMPTLLSTRFDDRRAKGLAKGWEFFRVFGKKKKSPLLRHGRDLFESVKSDLGSYRVYPYAAASECRTPKLVAANIFRALLDETARKHPCLEPANVRTVITVPASLNAEARRETREAAVAAGLNADLIELIDEPIAALLHLLNDQTAAAVLSTGEPRNVLVFDYGGGTLDLCLVKCAFSPDAESGLVAENLAISQYRRNGGNDVDRAVMDKVIWPQIEEQLGVARDELEADLRRAIEDTLTSTLARKLKEGLCNRITSLAKNSDEFSKLRSDLSETVCPDGNFVDERLGEPIKGRFKMTKSQFAEVMDPFLRIPPTMADLAHEDYSRSLLAPVWDCLAKANLSPEDLDVLVLHGGSCRNPFVRYHLTELFNDETGVFSKTTTIETPNLDTSVACGAALACYWKHARNIQLIRPVTSEDVGILTLGNRPVCLVASGTPLPFPTEGVHAHPADFYVPQTGQRELIVPFYAGATESNPRLSGSVKIPLPPEVRKGDVLRLKLSIDKNKILHWWYSVGDGEFTQAAPFNDPWTPRQMNPPEKRLVASRKCMSDHLQQNERLPAWMLINEIIHLRQAGQLEEAEIAARDYIADRGVDGDATNLLALVCGEQGNRQEEMLYAEKAAALAPSAATIVGNYGCTLIKAGSLDQGIAKVRTALGMAPESDYLYEWLGDAYRTKSDEAAALHEYRQCIRLLEKQAIGADVAPKIWSNLARLHQKIGEYERASEARSRAEDAHLNELYEGDHHQRVAGPDSGFWVDSLSHTQ